MAVGSAVGSQAMAPSLISLADCDTSDVVERIAEVLETDGDSVLLTSSLGDPTQDHVWRVTPGAAPERLTDEPGLHMVPDPALIDALRHDTRQVVAALGVLADRIRGDRHDEASSPPTALNQLATERFERAPVGSSPGADVRLALRFACSLDKSYELAERTPDIRFGG